MVYTEVPTLSFGRSQTGFQLYKNHKVYLLFHDADKLFKWTSEVSCGEQTVPRHEIIGSNTSLDKFLIWFSTFWIEFSVP